MSMKLILDFGLNSTKSSAQAREQLLPTNSEALIDFKNID
jgi:hypothetical protein